MALAAKDVFYMGGHINHRTWGPLHHRTSETIVVAISTQSTPLQTVPREPFSTVPPPAASRGNFQTSSGGSLATWRLPTKRSLESRHTTPCAPPLFAPKGFGETPGAAEVAWSLLEKRKKVGRALSCKKLERVEQDRVSQIMFEGCRSTIHHIKKISRT